MIRINVKGSFDKTNKFLARLKGNDIFSALEAYGQRGVSALAAATPVESGATARSWAYRIVRKRGTYSIEWYNTHENDGAVIAILIQYGHGTGTGGWVQGRDYINPAIQPIFDQIANDVWEKVTRG